MSPDAIMITDLNGMITMVNKQTLDLCGFESEKDIVGRSGIEFIVVEDQKRAVENIQKCLKEGKVRNVQYTFIKKSGKKYHGETSTSLITGPEGDPKSFIIILRDISERILMDQALRDSEEKYSNLFHKSNDSIIIHDLESNILDANEKCLELFGYSKTAISKLKIEDLHPKSVLKRTKIAFEKIIKDGKVSFEIDFMKKNKDTFPAEVSSSMFEIGDKKVIQGIIRDITVRKEIENSIRESETQLRSILDSMVEAIHVVNQDLIITMINSSFKQWNKELNLETDAIGKNIFEVFPFLPKKIKKEYEKVFETGEPMITEENVLVGDRKITTEIKKIPIFEKDVVTQIVTIVRNVSS